MIHYCSNFQQQLLHWCLPKVVITIKWKHIRNFDLNPQQQRATTFCVTNPFWLLELVATVNRLIFKSVWCQCSDNEVSWVKTLQLKKIFMAPFFMDGVQLPQGYSHFEEALFTIQFPEIPGTHFIDLGRMKGWVDLGATN